MPVLILTPSRKEDVLVAVLTEQTGLGTVEESQVLVASVRAVAPDQFRLSEVATAAVGPHSVGVAEQTA